MCVALRAPKTRTRSIPFSGRFCNWGEPLRKRLGITVARSRHRPICLSPKCTSESRVAIAEHQRNVIRAAEDERTVREDNTRSLRTAFEPRLCASGRRGARSAAPTTPYPRTRRQYQPHHPVVSLPLPLPPPPPPPSPPHLHHPPRYRRLASADIAAECLLWSSLGCWFTLSLADSGTHLRRTPRPEIPPTRSRSLLSSPDFATKLPRSG